MAKQNGPISQKEMNALTSTGTASAASGSPKGLITQEDMEARLKDDARYAPTMSSLDYNVDLESYSKYISNIKPLQNIDMQRAMNQPWHHQAANAVVQSVGEIVGGTLEGLGSIPEIFSAVADEQQGQAADFDNFLIGLGRSIREGAQENAPIYRTDPNKAFDVLDTGWWFSNMPSMVSTISMMVPAMAATRGLSWLGKMGKLGTFGKVGKAAANLSPGIKYATKLGLGAAVSRNAENFREAYQVYDETYQETLKALEDPTRAESLDTSEMMMDAREYYGTEKLTPQQVAEYVGSRASWRSYKINSANILFDALQFAPLLKASKIATRTGYFGKTNKVLEANGRKLTKLDKFTRNVTNPVLYPIASQLTEGVEEAVNFVGGEEGRVYAKELLGETSEPLSNRLTNYLQDGHMWESAAWGVLGGVVFTGATNLVSKDVGPQSQNAKLAEIENRKSTIASITAAMEAVENSNEDPQTKAIKLRNLKANAGFILGRNAARAGNADLVIEQLEDKSFQEQLLEGGFTTPEQLQEDVSLIKENILQAEALYKKHSGRFFYSEATGAARRMLENRGMELDQESALNKRRLQDAKTSISNLESGLNLTEEQRAAVKNQSTKDTIAILDTLANEAIKNKDQASAEMYRDMQRDLETTLDNTAGTIPANLPKELLESYMQESMYNSYQNHLVKQQNDLSSKETASKYQEDINNEIKRQKASVNKAVLDLINNKTTVDTELMSLANSKNKPKEVVEAAKNKIRQIEAANKKPQAEQRADNYEGPKANTPAGEPEGPKVKPPVAEPARQAGFMEKAPVEPTPPGQEVSGDPGDRPADLDGLVDPPAEAESAQEQGQGERIPGTPFYMKKTEEGPESTAHQAVGTPEVDLFTLGMSLNARLNLKTVEVKDTHGNTRKVERAKNAIVELNEEESGALEALFNLREGSEIIFTPEGDYVTKEGVYITSLNLEGLKKRLETAISKKSPNVAKDQQRVNDAQALLATAAEKGNIVLKVTDMTNGAIVNTLELQSLNNLKEHVERNGLALAENDVLTMANGETIIVPGVTNGRIYAIVDGPKSQVPVPLAAVKLSEVEGAVESVREAVLDLEQLMIADPTITNKDLRAQQILQRIGRFANVSQSSGIRMQRVKEYSSIVLSDRDGKTIEYVFTGVNYPVVQEYDSATKTRKTLNLNIADVLANNLLDVNTDLINSDEEFDTGAQTFPNYQAFVLQNFKTNVGGFRTTSGKIIPFSTVTTSPGEHFGISVRVELVGTAIKKPTIEERVEAVRPEAKKVKKPKPAPKVDVELDMSEDMDDLGLMLKADGQVTDYGRKENLDKAEAWFKSVFPEVPFIRVQGLINNGGELAYGLFADAAVRVSDMAIQGTAYHEAFHVAMHLYLNDTQRSKIYAEARKEYGNQSDLQLEEILAEKFRAFMITGEQEVHTPKTVVGRWFQKLKDLVKMFTSKPNHTQRLFRDIQSGKFNYKPTQQMINHAKRFKLNLAVEGMSSTELRQATNVMSGLVHGAVQSVLKNNKAFSAKLKEAGIDPTVENMVKLGLRTQLKKMHDSGYYRSENIAKVLNQYEDSDMGAGVFTRTLEVYRSRFGIDLTKASIGSLKRLNNQSIEGDAETDVNNEESLDGTLQRNYGDSLVYFNGKDSVSAKVRNAVQTTKRLSQFDATEFTKGVPDIHAAKENSEFDTGNFLGTPTFVEFDAVYPYLENNLSGISSPQEMMERLLEFAETANASYGHLYMKLFNDSDLQSAFYTHFSKQSPPIFLPTYESDTTFSVIPVNRNNSEFLIRDRFLSQASARILEGSHTVPKEEIIGNINSKMDNDRFAKKFQEALGRMDMDLYENGVNVLELAIRRELNKGTLTKSQLQKDLNRLATAFVKGNIENEKGNLTRLGKSIRYYKTSAIQNVVQNVEGKNIYGVTHGTFMSNFFTLLQNPTREGEARAMLTQMLKDPKLKRSNYMRLLVQFKGKDPVYENGLVALNQEGISKFNYGLLDGLKNEQSFGGVKYSNMTKEEYLAMSLGMFVNDEAFKKKNNKKAELGKITTPGITPSDKSTLYLLQTPRWEETAEFADGSGTVNTKSLIGRLVMGELQAMRQEAVRIFKDSEAAELVLNEKAPLQKFANPAPGTKKITPDTAGRFFKSQLAPFINAENFPSLFEVNGIVPLQKLDPIALEAVIERIQTEVIAPESQDLIQQIVELSETNDQIAALLSRQPGETLTEQAASVVKSSTGKVGMALHNYLHNYEYQLFFHAPEAEFKSDVDSGKRAASATTPGISLDPRIMGPKFRAMTLEDVVLPAAGYESMVEKLTDRFISQGIKPTDAKEKAESVLEPYESIETTDAQGYMTLDRYEKIVRARGMWSPQWETLFEKARSRKDMTVGELRTFMMPQKPLYYGRRFNTDLNRMNSDLIKLSSLPLMPALTKGTPLDELREFMEDRNVEEAFYTTAHKVGAQRVAKAHSVVNGQVEFNPDAVSEDNIRTLDNANYRIQLDTPEHLVDAKNKLGSQLAKLILADLSTSANYKAFGSAQKLINTYQDSITELINIEFDNLMQEIGAVEQNGKYVVEDISKFEELIKNELVDRNASRMLREAMQVENGRFVIPAFFSGASNKLESIILSLFTNRITNLKVPGATAIQVSSAMLSKDGKRPSVVFNEDGGIDHYEVLLPAYMKEQMTDSEGNVLPLEDIDPEALKMIGYRIPTEGKSSMAPMKVIGFLPNAMGSSIIVPDEFIVQMGSDFDIDKLFIQTKNVGKELTRKQELQNQVFDVIESVLQNPAHLEEILTPQGFDGLAKIANEIGQDRQMAGEGLNTQLFTTQAEFRQRNQVGGQMIGIAANINVFATVAQTTGMTLSDDTAIEVLYTENVEQIKKLYPNTHKVVSGGVIVSHKHLAKAENGEYVAANGSLITNNLKQFVGATVDNAKDPLFDKFNGTSYTVPTVMTMVLAGIPMETALYFSAQESIVNLSNTYASARGVFGTGASFEFAQEKERLLKEINKLTGESFNTRKQDVDEVFNLSGKARKPLSTKRLKDNLKKDYDSLTKDEKENYLFDQLDLIDKFRAARKAGQAVQDGYTVFKTDVAGAGPNTSVSRRILKTAERIHNYPDEGPRLLVGDKSAAEAIYPSLFGSKDASVYPILETYLTKANATSLDIASKFFLTETESGQYAINAILDQLTDGRWDDNIVKKAKNMINQYVLSETFGLYDAEILMGVSEDMGATPQERSIISEQRMREGNLSVAEMLHLVKKKYPKLANDDLHILSRLTPQLSNEQMEQNEGLKMISFENISDSVIDEALSESLEEMLFSDDTMLSTLAEMLVAYNYMTKGMSFQRGSYSKLFSPAILKEFGIPDTLYMAKNKADAGVPLFGTNPADLYASINFRDFRKPSKKFKEFLDDGSIVLNASDASKYGPFVFFGKGNEGRLYKKVTEQDGKVMLKPHPMYGIPGKLVEFDNSIIHKDKQVAQAATKPAQFSKLRQTVIEDSATTEDKVNLMKQNFAAAGIQVEVLTDETMEENAKVEEVNGQIVVTLNPNKVFGDTVIHEFGHIYVDLLGMDNALVKEGISQLRGTELWSKVEKAYPELSGDALAKEVLVTAIGREGAKLYESERGQKKWQIWLNKFFRAVGKMFGVQPNAARQLAGEMLANNMQRKFEGSLNSGPQYQKDIESLDNFFDEKKLLLKRLIKKYGENNAKGLVDLVSQWRETDHAQLVTTIDNTVRGFIADANAYLAEMDKFLQDENNRTTENMNNYYTTLYNYRQALSAFDDIGALTKEFGEDKATRRALKKLKNRVGDLNGTIAKIDRIAKKNLAETLKEVTSNPELAEDMMKIFKGDGIIAMDESVVQLKLDALADTNVAFIALAIKDYKVSKAENDEEIRRTIGSWQELVKRMKNDGVQMENLFERNANGKFTGKFIMPTIKFKKSERPNPDYNRLSSKQKEYLKEVQDLVISLTEHTSNDLFVKGYIPAIPLNEKNYWEQAKKATKEAKSRFNKFKNKHKEDTGIQEDDKDLEVIVDEKGNVVSMVPLNYMRKIDQLQYEPMLEIEDGMTLEQIADVRKENAEIKKRNAAIRAENEERHGAAVDMDLENTMDRFIMTAMNHKFKKEVEGKMLLIREQLRNMEIVKNPKLVDKLRSAMFEGKPSPTVNGAETNIFEHYDMWLKMVFYDEFEADETSTWKSISDGLRDYSSLVGIGLNVYSAVNNKTYGEMMISIEAAAGEFFSVKDWAQAKKEYNVNLLKFTKDRDSKKTDNFLYGVIKRFDVLQSQDELSGKSYAKGSKAHKLMMAKNAMYFMQHVGEHSMQNQVLFAMLRKERAMLDGKEVSLMDALELRDGYIEVKKGAKKADGTALTDRDLARFQTKVIAVNQYLHGIYNKEDAGTIQHYALGRLAMQFRKWARPGWNKRFGSKFGKSFWNERRESLDEGMYVTAFNFSKELFRDALNLETNAKAHWDKLSEQQKANLRRTMAEVGYMFTITLLAGLAKGLADDDEDNKSVATLAYMLDRSRTELLTYTPVWGWFNEGKKLMNSPVASFRQIETLSKLALHVGLYPFIDEEDRYYKGGMYYGQSKAGVWFKSMLPGVAIWQRWNFIERQAAYYKLYGF